MISKNNIEEKLFDYFEGELASSERIELEQFIDANPEFKTDFDAWEKSFVPQEDFTYDRVNELLVDEKTGKIAFLGRWKAGLLMLLVGTGLSFGLFQKINGGENVSTNEAESLHKFNKDTENSLNTQLESSDDETDIAGQLVDDIKQEARLTSSLNAQNKTLTTTNQAKQTKGNYFSSAAQTGGSAKAATPIVGLVASTATKQAATGVSGLLSGVQSSNTAQNSLQRSLRERSKFKNIDLGLATSSISELLSTPRIKKSRSKFEKYDKNELTFQNEKDPFFVLPNGTALGMNPSFAGNGKGLRLTYNYNYEWPELNDNYNTHILSLDTYVKALRGGVGVVLISDVLGHNKFSTKGAEVIYSPKFKLFGKTTIEPALKYGYYKKNVAWDQLKTNQLIDARTGTLSTQISTQISEEVNESSTSSDNYSNLGLSLLLNTSKLYIGFAYDHLLSADYNLGGNSETINVPGKLTAQVGGSIVPVKDIDFLILSPSLHFIKLGGYDKVWLCNVLEISQLFIGTSYSLSDEYLFSLGYDNNILRVSYSYGKTKSMVGQNAKKQSLHQLGLIFNFLPTRR
jgi:type IX secretion system PorP/SprF family membrane protein